jgi:pSer/pThr/pTyr-binding forkhead associated (FHA) protein
MKDGLTRKVATRRAASGAQGFLAKHSVTLVFASGPLAGTEIALERERVTLGRGAGADVVVEDASVSHLHAALELGERGFRLHDLDSTNGVVVNGGRTSVADLKHGDRLALGSVSFRYLVEKRASAPPTHQLHDE